MQKLQRLHVVKEDDYAASSHLTPLVKLDLFFLALFVHYARHVLVGYN